MSVTEQDGGCRRQGRALCDVPREQDASGAARSPAVAAIGATIAAGTSWTVATIAASVVPPRPYA